MFLPFFFSFGLQTELEQMSETADNRLVIRKVFIIFVLICCISITFPPFFVYYALKTEILSTTIVVMLFMLPAFMFFGYWCSNFVYIEAVADQMLQLIPVRCTFMYVGSLKSNVYYRLVEKIFPV